MVAKKSLLSRAELMHLAESYFEIFLPYFTDQAEGSLDPHTLINFSSRMKTKMGLTYLFEQKIRLNESYFAQFPKMIPYTLFHEMTHLWLYNCRLDPGHTQKFYKKMEQFSFTGFAVDERVYVHKRVVPEAKHIYCCENCGNRWYIRDKIETQIFCGLCFDPSQNSDLASLTLETSVERKAS